ncbi:hypothetical protein ABZT47_24805 [Sphaerisporangium sp. NPDC005289]
MFDTPRLNDLLRQIDTGQLNAQLPGGASAAQLLVQLVELDAWMRDHRVTLS